MIRHRHRLAPPAAPRLMAVLLALAVLGSAAAQEVGEPRCGKCNTTGKLEFDVSKKYEARHDHGDGWETLFCADAIESSNMAVVWEPCSRCKTPSVQRKAQAEWDALEQRNLAWLEEVRKIDAVAEVKDLAHVETTHFVVTWGVPKITSNKKTYRPHAAAHLYARRLEEFYADYQETFGVEDSDNMVNRHFVMVFEKVREANKASSVYAGMSGPDTQRRSGGVDRDSMLVTFINKSKYPSDLDLHRHLVHNMTHQMSAVYYNPDWFGQGRGLAPPWLNDKYGWLDAGLAHWWEWNTHELSGIDDGGKPEDKGGGGVVASGSGARGNQGSTGTRGSVSSSGTRGAGGGGGVIAIALPTVDASSGTFCFQEQDVTARWKGTDWRKNIYKAVQSGDVVSMAEVIKKPTPSLSSKEHQFVWSWVDFLIDRDPKAMGNAIKLAKHEKATRDILKEAYGLTTLSFEQRWTEWVKENYSPNT